MRIAIIGNSGSGKSTLARWLAARTGAAQLDLDSVAWEPGQIAVPRPESVAEADVQRFCSAGDSWIVEGCYANLMNAALPFQPLLLFLNPGVDWCMANCRSRPWEPHKYASKAEQDERLPLLLAWVSDYYTRDGAMSLAAHITCFEAYKGPKHEVTTMPALDPPSAEVLTWMR